MAMPTQPHPHAPVRGSLIGPWRVMDRVDSGSFGIIYRVVLSSDPSAGPFAMKMAAQPGDPRFEREAVLLSLVHHPGLPRYHDAGIWEAPGGQRYPYVVMQWVEGVPLYQWARATGRLLTSRQVLWLLAQVARALEALHRHGLHRDVKGDNILVRLDGSVVLLDLGAGWLPGSPVITEGTLPPGTPAYRSPEAFDFRERLRLDPAAHYEAGPADDVYALGVTAYRLVTGTYPPEPGSSGRRLPPSALATVSPLLEVLILRMLSQAREARGTAGELAEEMEKVAAGTGKGLDASVIPSASVLPTEVSRMRGPWLWRARVLARAAVPILALGAVILLVLVPRTRGSSRWEAAPLPAVGHAPLELEDGGVTGLADATMEALASTSHLPTAGVPDDVLGLPMPKRPLTGQRKPPCEPRVEREINGGCWVRVGDEESPCGPKMFDHEGRCYMPAVDIPREPTSEKP